MKNLHKTLTTIALTGLIAGMTATSALAASTTKEALYSELYNGAMNSSDGAYRTEMAVPKAELDSWIYEFQLNYLHSAKTGSYYTVSNSSGEQTRVGVRDIQNPNDVKEKDAAFTAKCRELADSVSGMSIEEKVRVLHDYIVGHCSYDYGYTNYTAYDCLIGGSSVCEGYAKAFYSLCREAGIEVLFVKGTADNGQRTGGHAWNRVKLSDGNWYEIDVCWDSCLGRDAYYLLSAEEMAKDHFPERVIP